MQISLQIVREWARCFDSDRPFVYKPTLYD